LASVTARANWVPVVFGGTTMRSARVVLPLIDSGFFGVIARMRPEVFQFIATAYRPGSG
jgi:hypothetical protein